MAWTLSQKWLTIFYQKAQHFVYFEQCDFVQILLVCGSNTVWKDFRLPIGKSIFAINLPLKLFSATVANVNTESLKSLHTLFDTYLDYMLAQFESNRVVQNVPNLKSSSFNVVFDKALTPFCKTFLSLKQLFDGKLWAFRLSCSVFQKLW